MRPIASPLALALALTMPTCAQAQGTLKAPTGPFRVGTVRVIAVDSSRAELSTAGTSDARRLVVQVWYPAQPTGRERRAPYVLELDQVAADLAEAVPEVAFGKVRTSALVDAVPITGHFPLVIFSHGMNSARYFYTTLLQDLASHGFVVAAVDHPFWALTTAFDTSHGVALAASMASRDQLTSDQIDGYMEDGVGLMAEDQAFVAERFPTLVPRLHQAVDGMPIGVAGHSMGGMAATLACSRFRVFAACASLDGLVWAREGSHADRRAGQPGGEALPAAHLAAVPAVRPLDRGGAVPARLARPAALPGPRRAAQQRQRPAAPPRHGDHARGRPGGGGRTARGDRVPSDRAGRGSAPSHTPDSALRLLPGAPAGSCVFAI